MNEFGTIGASGGVNEHIIIGAIRDRCEYSCIYASSTLYSGLPAVFPNSIVHIHTVEVMQVNYYSLLYTTVQATADIRQT